ncbi:hypothetical protein [Tengunoibacter tsumagoiensis]|uniref:Uncharacterized protein n=1 Tax=Tengunoibacter tsumagoiensis TaxID=2014871 RepID=A0A402A5X6_9CHLR|nr:hypothetical protein [Tengunoibacter tsumagoiensis]GCE14489.1 hypothetical protein KTT_43480 [Tengunoibacter tsumagoiensis]
MTTSSPFRHKVLLGWINDISSIPRTGKRWPIIDIDEQTMQDYRELFPVMKTSGFDTICIWGLFINHNWNPELKQSITEERRNAIRELLEEAHKHDVRVLAGLGLYSWGFEEIIRNHPEVAKNNGRFCWGQYLEDNGVVMCYSTEVAREWQRKIIDFIGEFEIDGFQLQSADQGRCACPNCRELGEMAYHAALNNEFATYIRTRWPQMTISVSGWGMSFKEEGDIPHLQKMSQALDYITDVTDQSIASAHPIRRQLIQTLNSSFGSLGGTVIVPPQRWDRLRWFLPHAEIAGKHITALASDGGSAYEFFAGPLVNPQYEMMTKYIGSMLKNPAMTPEEALPPIVEELFQPRTAGVQTGLVQALFALERLYFSKIEQPLGEFDFEPLGGEEPGPPIYLDRLTTGALHQYHTELQNWHQQCIPLVKETHRPSYGNKVLTCIKNVLEDVSRNMQTGETHY